MKPTNPQGNSSKTQNSDRVSRVPNMQSSSSVKRTGKSKVRAVPDFSKLHQKWENKFEQRKACAKKPCTIVQAFDLATSGGKLRPATTRVLNDIDQDDEHSLVKFKTDTKARASIVSGKGLNKKALTGRATIAATRQDKHLKTSQAMRISRKEDKTGQDSGFDQVDKKLASPDFSVLAQAQKSTGLEFQKDESALQSILDNTGIEGAIQKKSPIKCRQTMATFKTPSAPPSRPKPGTDMRRSIYYTDQKPSHVRHTAYTEFAQKTVSRLTLNAEKPDVNKSAPSPLQQIKVVPMRNSIYCKVEYPKLQNTEKSPTKAKAMRVLNKEQPVSNSSPALRVLKRTPQTARCTRKWRDILDDDSLQPTNEKDTLPTRLDFDIEGEGPSNAESNNELAALEKRLEEEIEQEKMDDKENEENTESGVKPPPLLQGKRVVFGILSDNEIARRSSPSFNPLYKPTSPYKSKVEDEKNSLFNVDVESEMLKPHSPLQRLHKSRSPRSLRRASPNSPRFQRTLSPLVKDSTSSDRIRHCKKFTIAKDNLDETLDIVTVHATDSDASILNGKDKSVNSSLQSSPLRTLSPNVEHYKGDRQKGNVGSKSPLKAYGSLEQQVMRVAASLDKENLSSAEYILDKDNISLSPKMGKFDKKVGFLSPLAKLSLSDKMSCNPSEKVPVSPLCKLSLKDKLASSSSESSPSVTDSDSTPQSPLATRLAPTPPESPVPHKVEDSKCPKVLSRRRLSLEEPLPNSPGSTKRRLSSPKDAPERQKVRSNEEQDLNKLNITISESMISLDEQMSLLQSRCEESTNDNTEHLLKQLEMIQKKQQQLLNMQIKLQAKLEQKKAAEQVCKESTTGIATQYKKDSAEENIKPCTPKVYDRSQSYADFIAANVVDISPLTASPHTQTNSSVYNSDLSSPLLSYKQDIPQQKSTAKPSLPVPNIPDQTVPLQSKITTPVRSTASYNIFNPLSPCCKSPAMFSPKPVMSGSAQLLLPSPSPIPIQTTLALRNMAIGGDSFHNTSLGDISCTPEESPAAAAACRSSTTPGGGQVLSSSIPTNTLTFSTRSTPLIGAHTAHTTHTISATSVVSSPRAKGAHMHTTPQRIAVSRSTNSDEKSSVKSCLDNSISYVTPEKGLKTSAAASPGSLSLAGNLQPTSKPPSTPINLRNTALSNAFSRFYDALLDDEVALYACRVHSTSPAKMLPRIQDPVAKTLMHGDEMHFVPVFCDQEVPLSPLPGSAFASIVTPQRTQTA